MKKAITTTITVFFTTVILLILLANDTTENKIQKEFSGVTFIELATISGNGMVIRHNKKSIIVTVEYDYKPAESFKPVFEQEGNKLKLKENITGENFGLSNWTIMAPDSLEFKFGSASGNFSAENISGKFEVGTASGNITADRIAIIGKSGFGTASGNIMASDIKVFGPTGFGTASGNVEVSLAQSPLYNLDACTASGNATIDFQNNSVTGLIEMRAKVDLGVIICPYRFDMEDVVDDEEKYMVKKVKLDNDEPVIKIHTVSGKAVLKK